MLSDLMLSHNVEYAGLELYQEDMPLLYMWSSLFVVVMVGAMLADVISLTLFASFVLPVGLYTATYDRFYIRLIFGLLVANGIVEAIKLMFGSRGFYGRPAAAKACDVFCKGGHVGGLPGFPSGHMTNVSMIVTALWWHTRSPSVLVVGLPWITAMAWARWQKRCHNWQQILAGICTGTFFGILITYT